MASPPKNDQLNSAETCALYYFPEIPCAANKDAKAAAPAKFSSGSFEDAQTKRAQETESQSSEQIQTMLEEAFQKGLEQGRAEVTASQKEKIQHAVNALETGINEIHRVRQHDIERLEVETVRLALSIAKKVIGHASEHDEVINHVVKKAMEKVNDTRHLVIRLNHQDLEAVQDQIQDLLPADDFGTLFRVEADETIHRGGCVIETKLGDIDARIDRQIKIIEELLIDQLPK